MPPLDMEDIKQVKLCRVDENGTVLGEPIPVTIRESSIITERKTSPSLFQPHRFYVRVSASGSLRIRLHKKKRINKKWLKKYQGKIVLIGVDLSTKKDTGIIKK